LTRKSTRKKGKFALADGLINISPRALKKVFFWGQGASNWRHRGLKNFFDYITDLLFLYRFFKKPSLTDCSMENLIKSITEIVSARQRTDPGTSTDRGSGREDRNDIGGPSILG
jgi:hypothetical protein